jgi:putative DNA primase/helicase
LLIEFLDASGTDRSFTMPAATLAKSDADMLGALFDAGLSLPTDKSLYSAIAAYLRASKPEKRGCTVDRTGWHGDAYILPDYLPMGNTGGERVMCKIEGGQAVAVAKAGGFMEWAQRIGAPCAGNSRLVLAICEAFAAPLRGLLDLQGGILHLVGSSSCGKSTALRIAASVYGPRQFVRTWNTTKNGLEGICAAHNHMLLPLDELAEMQPQDVGRAVYLISNGLGKSRMHADGGMRKSKTWVTSVLSSGEVGLDEMMREAKSRTQAGQEVRFVGIDADAGAGMGIFERVPDGMHPGEFADMLKKAADECHGYPFFTLVGIMAARAKRIRELFPAAIRDVAGALAPAHMGAQVKRVAERFAAAAVAGEFATRCGITGWESGEALRAAETCFRTWLGSRGTSGDSEPLRMHERLRYWIASNRHARLLDWNEAQIEYGDKSSGLSLNRASLRTANVAGFHGPSKDGDGYAFFIDPEAFRSEVASGYDPQRFAKVLTERGVVERAEGGKVGAKKTRGPTGINDRFFIVKENALNASVGDADAQQRNTEQNVPQHVIDLQQCSVVPLDPHLAQVFAEAMSGGVIRLLPGMAATPAVFDDGGDPLRELEKQACEVMRQRAASD